MKNALRCSIAALALMASAPAFAEIVEANASDSQGTLVHGNGGKADVGTDITGTLGAGPDAPEVVHFTGNTTASGDVNDVRLQQGAGQAELTGAVMSGNQDYALISGDIFLTDNAGMEWIELALQDVSGGTVEFTLSALDAMGNAETDAFFSYLLDPNGENKFAFAALNGESITNLSYNIVGGTAGSIRQVRIASADAGVPAVPEPATWAMMLFGFGAVGFSMRRRRQPLLAQIA